MGIKSYIRKKLTKTIVEHTDTTVCEGAYLEGKTALIIGGSGGIGGGIAEAFVKNGCRVIISGTNEDRLKELCIKLGDHAKYIILDLQKVEDIHQGISEAAEVFGKIDIFVHAAGIHGKEKFGVVTEATYDSVLDINLKSVFFSCQEISNYMISEKIKGHILIVSSASCAKPAWTPYEISKWGVRGFTIGLADTLIPYGIVVNAIAPGPVGTKMIGREGANDLAMPVNPSGRMATINEVANLAVFMCSNAGDMIVGDTFFISGGSGTIKMHN